MHKGAHNPVIPVLDTGIFWQIVGSSPTMTQGSGVYASKGALGLFANAQRRRAAEGGSKTLCLLPSRERRINSSIATSSV